MHYPNRDWLRARINGLLAPAGVRVVNVRWGPRGFAASFGKLARQGVEPKCIVDIGAATGEWTRECLNVFPNAEYFMVDPLEENQASLETLCRARRNVHFRMCALGAAQGELALHVHGDQSSFFPSEYDETGSLRRVRVETLDNMVSSGLTVAPDIIKVDAQGFELEVLRGSEQAMSTTEFVLLEVSFRETYIGCPLAHEVIAAMGKYGFRIYDLCTYSQRPMDLELFQSDILFARGDSRVFAEEGYA